MKCARRIIVNGATVVSLLLCVATAALWVRSYRISDKWHWSRVPDGRSNQGKIGWVDVWTVRGRLGILIETNSAYLNDAPGGLRHETVPLDIAEPVNVTSPQPYYFTGDRPFYRVYFDHAGFAYYRSDFNTTYHDHNGNFPLWFLMLFTALGPLVAVGRVTLRFRATRRRNGHCLTCGYDLRATPDRCPECGTLPAVRS
jgi:hypothetical protein